MLQILVCSFITKPVMIAAIIVASVLVELFLVLVVADVARKSAARKIKAIYEPDEDAPAPVFADALTLEQQKYYEAIVARVNETQGVTVKTTADAEEFRLGKFRVLRLLVKSGVLFAQLVTYGKDFQAQAYGGHADAEFSLNVIAVDSASAVRDVKAAYSRVLSSLPNA
ncbi:MAG: hypothetical protein E7363_04705 [Clostridiales bacterium]|nr:hypothetical protein [Clostridiales bacterium]